MANAHSARTWFLDHCGDERAIARHFVALSTNAQAVGAFGIDPANMEIGLENGVEDITDEDDVWEVHCAPEDFDALSRAFEAAGIVSDDAEVSMLARCREVLPVVFAAAGARCERLGYCPEAERFSCGRYPVKPDLS